MKLLIQTIFWESLSIITTNKFEELKINSFEKIKDNINNTGKNVLFGVNLIGEEETENHLFYRSQLYEIPTGTEKYQEKYIEYLSSRFDV
jgi:hypothetical protein